MSDTMIAVQFILVVLLAVAIVVAIGGAFVSIAVRARAAYGRAGLVLATLGSYLALLAALRMVVMNSGLHFGGDVLVAMVGLLLLPVFSVAGVFVDRRGRIPDPRARRKLTVYAVVAFVVCAVAILLLVVGGLASMNPDHH